jgi:hypothetical protein
LHAHWLKLPWRGEEKIFSAPPNQEFKTFARIKV